MRAALLFLPLVVFQAIAQDAKVQVPSASEFRQAEKTVKGLYKDDYAKVGRADRVALARKLLESARGTKSDAVVRYYLLVDAKDLGAVNGDPETAFAAIDELALSYEVNSSQLRVTALADAKKAAVVLDAAIDLVRFLLKRSDLSSQKEDYEEASRWMDEAKAVVKNVKEPSLLKEVQALSADLADARKEAVAAKKAQGVLTDSFDDPEANLTLGRYLAFFRSDWDRGLRLMSKGPDGPLKTAAKVEVGGALTPETGLEKGEAWLEAAAKAPYKRKTLARARYWLESSLKTAAGIVRAKIEKRLDDLDKADLGPTAVNVAKAFDAKKDSVAGDWKLLGSGILSPRSVAGVPHKAIVPFEPGEEYDLRILIEPKEDGHCGIGLVSGSSQAILSVNGGGCGLANIDGADTAARYSGPLLNDKEIHVLFISVRKTGIAAQFDGKSVLDWRGEAKRLSVNGLWTVPNAKALFLISGGSYNFIRIVYVPVTGSGKALR